MKEMRQINSAIEDMSSKEGNSHDLFLMEIIKSALLESKKAHKSIYSVIGSVYNRKINSFKNTVNANEDLDRINYLIEHYKIVD